MSSDDAREARESEYGYREVSDKVVRLAEWAHRKEKREFAALLNKLRCRKRYGAIRTEGGPRLAATKTASREGTRRLRARELARQIAAWMHRPPVLTCASCGSTWCPVPWLLSGKTAWTRYSRWCREACRKRRCYQTDEKYRAKRLAEETNRYRTAASKMTPNERLARNAKRRAVRHAKQKSP